MSGTLVQAPGRAVGALCVAKESTRAQVVAAAAGQSRQGICIQRSSEQKWRPPWSALHHNELQIAEVKVHAAHAPHTRTHTHTHTPPPPPHTTHTQHTLMRYRNADKAPQGRTERTRSDSEGRWSAAADDAHFKALPRNAKQYPQPAPPPTPSPLLPPLSSTRSPPCPP